MPRRYAPTLTRVAALLAGLLLAGAVAVPVAAATGTLRPGDSGTAVTCWQKKLRWVALARPSAAVPVISADGRYGSATTTATKAFQRNRRLTQDGVAGPQTQGAMQNLLYTAAHSNRDEYAAALYSGRCATPEPMICRRVAGTPYARQDPNRDAGWVHYAGSTSCTRLDPRLSYQDALLYLTEDNGSVNSTTLTTARNQRTNRIDLQKTVRAPAVELRAEFVIQLHGSVMFVSYPGCSRQSSSMISCRWTSAPYDNS